MELTIDPPARAYVIGAPVTLRTLYVGVEIRRLSRGVRSGVVGATGVGNYLPRDFAVDLRRGHAAPPIGPLSSAVIDSLQRVSPALHARPIDVPVSEADPYGLDLQLALYVCHELHYRGFAGVNPRWEWNPALLHVRGRLEEAFLTAVRHDVGEIGPDETAADARDTFSVEPVDGAGPSYYLRDIGTWRQMREYLVHRSLYHRKEADPHAFASRD